MDGRVFTPEDELDVLHEDLGRARRRVSDLERAPFDGRCADPQEHERTLLRARENVRELERELAVAIAAQREDDEFGLTVGYDEYLGGRR